MFFTGKMSSSTLWYLSSIRSESQFIRSKTQTVLSVNSHAVQQLPVFTCVYAVSVCICTLVFLLAPLTLLSAAHDPCLYTSIRIFSFLSAHDIPTAAGDLSLFLLLCTCVSRLFVIRVIVVCHHFFLLVALFVSFSE